MLAVNQTITATDLAQALQGEQGTFVVRQGGQLYSLSCQPGHSIVSGPTPLGPPITGFVQIPSLTAEPWVITKFSDQPQTQLRSQSGGQTQQTENQGQQNQGRGSYQQ